MILYQVKNEKEEKKLTAAWFGKNAQLKRMKFKESMLALWYKGRSETTTEGLPDGSSWRICLSTQETWTQSQVWDDPICLRHN